MILHVTKDVIVTIPPEHTTPKMDATNLRLVLKCTTHIRSGNILSI